MVFVFTTLGVFALLTEVGVPPDVLAVRNSSLILETLPDFALVCEETDKGLEEWYGFTMSECMNIRHCHIRSN